MDAVELLRGDAPFVADTSLWWRIPSLVGDLADLLHEAMLARRMLITPIMQMEVLYSARTASEYADVEAQLSALRMLRNDRAAADAAMSAIRDLAERGDGYHRVPVSDALIAAVAAART
jgi:predicted nucleic acid-binding protein